MKQPVQWAPITLSSTQKSSYFLNCGYVLTWAHDQKKGKLPDMGNGGQFSALLKVAVRCLIEHLRLWLLYY